MRNVNILILTELGILSDLRISNGATTDGQKAASKYIRTIGRYQPHSNLIDQIIQLRYS